MLASEVMTLNPATLDVTATARDALRLLAELDIRHLPIVDQGELVGILSDRDLGEFLGSALDEFAGKLFETAVVRLMSSDVHTVGPEDELRDVIDLMIEHKLGGVPVVTNDPRALVGMVSYVDIIREARSHL